jgi:hypothetical protein
MSPDHALRLVRQLFDRDQYGIADRTALELHSARKRGPIGIGPRRPAGLESMRCGEIHSKPSLPRDEVVLGAGDAEQMCELVDHQPNCRIPADEPRVCVLMLAHSPQASTIDSATPLGLQAPGLTITSAT